MRVWNKAIDEKIVRDLENNGGKTHYYHLLKTFGMSSKTLNEHLKRLEEQEIIHKDEFQIGKKRYIRFTPKAILKILLGILEVKPKNVTMRYKKVILLILGTISKSYVGHVNSDGSLRESGHIPGQLYTTLGTEFPGVTVTDVLNHNRQVDNNNYIFDDFSQEEIVSSINKLRQAKVILPSITSTKEGRYIFDSDYQKLYPFLRDCYHILWILLINMQHKWVHIRKKPTSEEVNWFIFIVGRVKMNSFFTSLNEERKDFPEHTKWNYLDMFPQSNSEELKKAVIEAKISILKAIKSTDLTVKKMTRELDKRYSEIAKEYPVFYELLKEIICPSFLRR